jgi:hypothetical protein
MQTVCELQGLCCEALLLTCIDPPPPDQEARAMRAFERGIGIFLKHGEKGFRGLDFQARLVFEDVFGSCANPGREPDFVSRLVAAARENPAATIGDVVSALKDRLIGQAAINPVPGPSGANELAAVEAMFGSAIDTRAADAEDLEGSARAMCGVLVSSPLFLLTGIAAPDASEIPILTPTEASYQATCASLSEPGLTGGLVLTCGDSGLEVSLPP